MTVATTANQTAEGRLAAVTLAAEHFSNHIESVPGSVLDGSIRLAIASAARSCLSCKACSSAQSMCFRPSESFLNICTNKLDHDCGIVPHSDQHTSKLLTGLVHAIVHHQTKLNEQWYEEALRALESSPLLPEGQLPESKDANIIQRAPAYAAVAEIILLTSMSHAINVAFQSIGRDPPPLPPKSETRSNQIDYSSLIKRLYMNKGTVAGPLFTWKDVNQDSPELRKLQETTIQSLPEMLNPMLPYSGLFLALDDCVMLSQYMKTCYMPAPKNVMCTWLKLDPTVYCPSVTRHDVEVLAAAIAEQHSCDFWHHSHGALAESSLGNAEFGRDQALANLGKTVATLPFDCAAVQKEVEHVRRQENGDELVAEAIATIANFEMITRVADATMRIPPKGVFGIVRVINRLGHRRHEIALYGAAAVAALGSVLWIRSINR